MNRDGVWIVIAAYREEKSIGNVVAELKKAGYPNIVVVDDGSKDRTFSMASSVTSHTLRHVINRGQGAALKTGIDYALLQGAEIIVTFDADGQHRVEDLQAMITPVQTGETDITIGSRFLGSATNLPILRRIVLRGGALVTWIMYGIKLTDSHNGFRAMSRKAAEEIELKSDRMEHASEFIDQIKRKKLRYKEIPVIIRYTDYSKAHSSQGAFPALRIFYKMLLHKLLR
ncbi:MAG TPA: glycosyltransferase family 2 protein [Candidatus Nanoarchaeia archaeon]|nr:glycosyltransferase family 2 protein [Candidatus Nanoarchaeia archaeon]